MKKNLISGILRYRVLPGLVASVFFLCSPAILIAESPKEHFEDLVKRGGGFVHDTSTEDGDFLLSVSSVPLDSRVQNPNQLLEMARLMAQRDLSGIFGTKVNSREELTQQFRQYEIDEKEIIRAKQFLTAVYRSEIDQALAGAEILEVRSFAGELYVGFLLSQKRLKAVGKLGGAIIRGDEVSGVVALGLAMVGEAGEADARSRALANAKRNAVEQAFGAVVQSASQLRDLDPSQVKSKVFTASFGSVTRHTVVFDKRDGAIYKVKIRATVSKEIPLDKIVAAWQDNGASFYLNPKNSRNPDESPNEDLLDQFSEFFGDSLGFKLTNERAAADYEITLRTRFTDKKDIVTRRAKTQLFLTVEIRDTKTGKQVLKQFNDPRDAVSSLIDPDRRRYICASMACKQLKPDLQKKVGKLVMDQVQNGREVRVVFSEPKNLNGEGYDQVLKLIRWTPGVQNPNKTVLREAREVRFTMRFRGNLNLLENTLTAEMMKRFPNFHPVLKEMGANQIVYKVPPAEAWGMNLYAKNQRVLARMALAAVVRIDVFLDGKPTVMGSGFLIGPNLVASNHHVVKEGNGLTIKLIGQERTYRIIKILAVDQHNDIALMRVEKGIEATPLELGDSSSVRVGDKIYSAGNPKGLDGTFSQGIISNIHNKGNLKIFQYTAPTSRGSSGGPIINDQGQVVAVHKWGRLREAELANAGAPVEFLKELIEKNKIKH